MNKSIAARYRAAVFIAFSIPAVLTMSWFILEVGHGLVEIWCSMLEIAGGIILAIIILCCLPYAIAFAAVAIPPVLGFLLLCYLYHVGVLIPLAGIMIVGFSLLVICENFDQVKTVSVTHANLRGGG